MTKYTINLLWLLLLTIYTIIKGILIAYQETYQYLWHGFYKPERMFTPDRTLLLERTFDLDRTLTLERTLNLGVDCSLVPIRIATPQYSSQKVVDFKFRS
jgi:hypothetical protein